MILQLNQILIYTTVDTEYILTLIDLLSTTKCKSEYFVRGLDKGN